MNYLLKQVLKWIVTNGLPYIIAWLEQLIDLYVPMSRQKIHKQNLYKVVDEILGDINEPPKKLARMRALNAIKLSKL